MNQHEDRWHKEQGSDGREYEPADDRAPKRCVLFGPFTQTRMPAFWDGSLRRNRNGGSFFPLVVRSTEPSWRCHVPATYNRSYLGRMWAFVGFTLTATLAAVRAERPDVIIATSPPLTTGTVRSIRSPLPAQPVAKMTPMSPIPTM